MKPFLVAWLLAVDGGVAPSPSPPPTQAAPKAAAPAQDDAELVRHLELLEGLDGLDELDLLEALSVDR